MQVTKNLGSFVSFRDNDPAILASHSLKSADDIGSGVVTGTPTYDATKGIRLDGTTSGCRITWDNGAGNSIVPTVEDLDAGYTIQFEVERDFLFNLSGSAYEYLLSWLTGTAQEKRFSSLGDSALDERIKFTLRTNGGGSNTTTGRINVEGKSEFVSIHISVSRSKVDLYIDKQRLCSTDNEEDEITSLVEEVFLGNRPIGTDNFSGYMRNLQVINRPIFQQKITNYSRIHIIGDSVPTAGNWESTGGSDLPVFGTETGQTGDKDDVGMIPTISRRLSAVNKFADVRAFSENSTGIIAGIAAGNILDQVDGTGNGNGTVEDDALVWKPQIVVINGGYNDALSGTYSESLFKLSYQVIVDEINTRNPECKIMCVTINTLSNDSTYDSAAYVANVDSVNSMIEEVVNENSNCSIVDWFTESGGHNANSVLFLFDDFHHSVHGSRVSGDFIASKILRVI